MRAAMDDACAREDRDPRTLSLTLMTWILGGAEQAADHLGRLAAAGVTGVLLQHQLPTDLDMLDEIMCEVAPRL
jgi:hypothetical protein